MLLELSSLFNNKNFSFARVQHVLSYHLLRVPWCLGAAAAAAVTNDIKPVPSKLTLVDHIDRPSKQKPLPAKQENLDA